MKTTWNGKFQVKKIENINSIGTFDFKTSYAIKIHEETFNIQNKFQTIPLLSTLALQEFLKKRISLYTFWSNTSSH